MSRLRNWLRRWLDDDKCPQMAMTPEATVVQKPNREVMETVRTLIREGRQAVIPVKGYSMRVFVENCRDKAILAPFDVAALKRGDVVLARVEGDYFVLHRIIRAEGDRLILMGDGNVRGTECCRRSDVVAQAVGFIRKGRRQPDMVTGLKWRVYSALWMALRPLRRWLLLAWRIKRRLLG